ncbi:MAG: FtsX-like permease family protein [Candidatus Eisenbacteria bacterium]|nr:FtsX-like permease family protein [Candidatus Latescibacterota bacterium]MBD3302168.1 FtsX-like permease family protein [Candidatus Eisenbacteria bacterium]
MSLLESLRLALSVLWSNRLRSFLTILGILVAVSSVVAVVAVIEGLDRYVSNQILSTGSHVFQISKFGFSTDHDTYLRMLRRKDLTLDDAVALERTMQHARAVVPVVSRGATLERGKEEARGADVVGLGDGYPELRTLDVVAGRHLTRSDVQGRRFVAVIGEQVREKLFEPLDPIGREMKVGRHRFRVVGLLKERGSVLGQSQDNVVLVPVTTYRKMYGRRDPININVRAAGADVLDEAQEEATLLLKLRRGLNPWDEPDFSVSTSEMFFELYKNFTRGIYGLTLGIVAVSLLIGGIVVMNIMFVSVTERTREIGIRRALGARQRDIVIQFLSESVALAVLGGLFGVLLGGGAAVLLERVTPLPAAVRPWSVAVGLLLASSVGLFFGIYPATRASKLVPVEALRHEN